MKRARTSLVLCGVALALLGFILFFERGTLSTTEREGRKGRVLDGFVRDKVERIELQRRGVTTALVKVPINEDDQFDVGGWKVEQPYQAKADRNSVDSLLGALEWIDARRSLGELSAQERERFGLTRPRFRVGFVAGRERSAFSVGGPAADGGGYYLQVQGQNRAYVVGKDLIEALDHDPNDYHTRELHDGVSVYALTKLRLLDASGERSLERRDGLSYLRQPSPSLVSEPVLRSIFDALDALRASRYIGPEPPDAAAFGLGQPRTTLEIESKRFDPKIKNKSTLDKLTLRVGAACSGHAGESYLRVNEGELFCASDTELAKLNKSADELRETRLLPLEDAEIRGVEIASGSSELKLAEAGSDGEVRFSLLEGGRELKSGVADPAALSAWYKALRGVTLTGFEPGQASRLREGKDASFTRLTFQRGKEHAPLVLKVSAADPSRLSATRADDSTLLHAPNAARALLTPSAARFRKPRVLDESESGFEKLLLSAPDGVTETVTKGDGGYALAAAQRGGSAGLFRGKAERASVDELLRLLSKLDALRFVADGAAPEHGFAAPYRTLRFEFARDKAGPISHSLELGAASGDEGRYARLDADPAVFLVSNALVQKLEQPLVSRDALAVELDQLASFEIAGRVRVERKAEQFAVAGAADANPARAERLARALATLHASRAVAYGKADAVAGMERPELRVSARLRDGRELTWTFGAAASGAPDNPQVFVRRSDLDVTFQVPRTALDALLERSGAG